MYSVSDAYKLKMLDPAQEHRITGNVGSLPFSESNVVAGSFQISNQCTDSTNMVLGSCYIGQMICEFTGINIAWNDWIGKVITVYFGLKTGTSTWEDIPMGVFTIAEATHTEYGVRVTAYDNMAKFDKEFNKENFQFKGSLYSFLVQVCQDCGVNLLNTMADIGALPNGNRQFVIYGAFDKDKDDFANDITTYRDLLYWIAQTLGCFATMSRGGYLWLRPYTQTVVDEISNHDRISGATFEDYITHYVGIYVTNLDDDSIDYYGYNAEALQAEYDETVAESETVQTNIASVDADLAELERAYEAHEITEQEYLTQKAALTAERKALVKTRKRLEKRIAWLTKALNNTDVGADIEVGANPFLMAKKIANREAPRRAVLGALDNITYTPFTASVVCGAHYDLGDVIQFSGGLYNSASDCFGCVMAITYNHNGGTDLEGFGTNSFSISASSMQVRNKTQKSADRANRNSTDIPDLTLEKAIPNSNNSPVVIRDTTESRASDMVVTNYKIWFRVWDGTTWREGYFTWRVGADFPCLVFQYYASGNPDYSKDGFHACTHSLIGCFPYTPPFYPNYGYHEIMSNYHYFAEAINIPEIPEDIYGRVRSAIIEQFNYDLKAVDDNPVGTGTINPTIAGDNQYVYSASASGGSSSTAMFCFCERDKVSQYYSSWQAVKNALSAGECEIPDLKNGDIVLPTATEGQTLVDNLTIMLNKM